MRISAPPSDADFLALKGYFAAVEKSPIYPPLGFCPSLRKYERDVASILSFMCTIGDQKGQMGLDEWGYPLRKLPPALTAELKRGLVSCLTSFLR